MRVLAAVAICVFAAAPASGTIVTVDLTTSGDLSPTTGGFGLTDQILTIPGGPLKDVEVRLTSNGIINFITGQGIGDVVVGANGSGSDYTAGGFGGGTVADRLDGPELMQINLYRGPTFTGVAQLVGIEFDDFSVGDSGRISIGSVSQAITGNTGTPIPTHTDILVDSPSVSSFTVESLANPGDGFAIRSLTLSAIPEPSSLLLLLLPTLCFGARWTFRRYCRPV